MLFDPLMVEDSIASLGQQEHLADPKEIVRDALSLFKPPANISTVECAEQFREIKTPKGDATRKWSRDLTPYLVGPQDALDDRGGTGIRPFDLNARAGGPTADGPPPTNVPPRAACPHASFRI